MSKSLFRKKSIDKILRDAEEGLVDSHEHHTGLKKILNVRDLTFMGMAWLMDLYTLIIAN